MILYVIEKHVGTEWHPLYFWIGTFRLSLEKHFQANRRTRRVSSREEADRIACVMPSYQMAENVWDLDTYALDWVWPPTRDALEN